MGRILCFFGIHDWGRAKNIRGGGQSLIMLAAIFEHLLNPPTCDRECLRCGKVKEFYYDSRRG